MYPAQRPGFGDATVTPAPQLTTPTTGYGAALSSLTGMQKTFVFGVTGFAIAIAYFSGWHKGFDAR